MAIPAYMISPEMLRIAQALGQPAMATGQAAQTVQQATQQEPVQQTTVQPQAGQPGASNPAQEVIPQTGDPVASRAAQLAQTQAAANPTPQAQAIPTTQATGQTGATQTTQEQQNTQQAQQAAQTQQAQQTVPTQSGIGGSGAVAQQEGSALGGAANLSPEAAAAGAQGNNTQASQSWWDQMVQNFTGAGLEGDALKDWQKTAGMASLLTSLGANVSGDHWTGRFGNGMNNFIQSGIIDKNNREAENKLGNSLQTAGQAMSNAGKDVKQQAGLTAPIKQPSANTYQTKATNTYGTGGLTSNNSKESLLAQIRALGMV